MGYHPGAEDDGVYLTAVKSNLNPALYPHDAAFFKLQMATTVFDNWMAAFIHESGIPIAWAELFWQFFSLFLILWAGWSIIRQLFDSPQAQWAGVALLSAMFTLPVAGTALYIADQYMHPRAIATALILFGASQIVGGKRWLAVPLSVLAFVFHPLMGALGISFCCVLALVLSEPAQLRIRSLLSRPVAGVATPVGAFIPFAWILGTPSPSWLEAVGTRHWFRLYQWTWYEWLGALGPIVLFGIAARIATKQGEVKLAKVATAIFAYSIFQQVVAMIILAPQSPIGFSTLEPMRYLHIDYIFLVLVGGAYLGRYVLQRSTYRWGIFLLLANGGMLLAQRQIFPGTEHIELPGANSQNPWLQAFAWVRINTPTDAYFAMDPRYLEAPGEDYHSFRALAERSQLADGVKDASVVTKVPALGPDWDQQVKAQQGWRDFKLADFERLKTEFGVDWVLVSDPPPAGLDCRWHNGTLAVCTIP